MGLRLHVGVATQFLWTFQVMYPLSTPSFHTRKDRWDPIFLRRFIHPRLKRRPKNNPFFLKRNNHSKKHAKTHGLWMDWTTCKNSWFMNGLDPPSLKKNRHTNPVSFFKKNDRFAMVYAPSRSNLSSNIPIQIWITTKHSQTFWWTFSSKMSKRSPRTLPWKPWLLLLKKSLKHLHLAPCHVLEIEWMVCIWMKKIFF